MIESIICAIDIHRQAMKFVFISTVFISTVVFIQYMYNADSALVVSECRKRVVSIVIQLEWQYFDID